MSHGFYGLPADGIDRSGEPGNNVVGPMVGDYPTMYDSEGPSGGSMLSDMFNFPQPATVDVLQIPSTGYRLPPPAWPGKQESQLLPDPSAAMRLFLMTPQERRSTSPPRQQAHQDLQTNHPALIHSASFGSSTSYTGGGGGLSLSLSPNLQRLEMAKVEGELGINNNSSGYYDQQVNVGGVVVNGQIGGVAPMLRQSKYATAAQELLQEFCSVGKGQVKGGKRQRGGSSSSNPNPSSGHAGGGGGSSSNSKEGGAVLSPSDRFEQQRRKAKLLAMLDEVDRRYSRYCEQMQSVVISFDSVMGFGSAMPYTALAQKAMSRHFRCLKDAVAAQLKKTCEVLGEKDCSVSLGITKGETPRLKLLDQSLRQQRAFQQMGMMETEAWRPQRGLPERSVNILRSWLFEHFLHPYPSDSDKHLLARQTGLSRNQVSNWFINARVRLWKPMIEEMYLQEAHDEEDKSVSRSEPSNRRSQSPSQTGAIQIAPASHAQSLLVHRHQYQHQQQFSSSSSLDNPQFLSTYQPSGNSGNNEVSLACLDLPGTAELCGFDMPTPDYGIGMVDHEAGRIRFGASGDVSLTLGLRHAGNVPEASRFSVRDFGGL